MEKEEISAKKIECIIGFILLIPPIIGIISFVIGFMMTLIIDNPSALADLDFGDGWTAVKRVNWNGDCFGVAMSAAPIYLGLMAIAGAYLIKNNIQYFFIKKKD